MTSTQTLGRLSGAPPTIVPDLGGACPYAVAAGFLEAPSSIREHLTVVALTGGGGGVLPSRWRRSATRDLDRLRAWLRDFPSVPVAARTGQATRLVVVEAEAEALMFAESTYGKLPADCVRSVNDATGVVSVWMRLPDGLRSLPTYRALVPGVTIWADGSYAILPGGGGRRWVAVPDSDGVDFQRLGRGWITAIQAPAETVDSAPTVRFFPVLTVH